jgi:hypothetical protein
MNQKIIQKYKFDLDLDFTDTDIRELKEYYE